MINFMASACTCRTSYTKVSSRRQSTDSQVENEDFLAGSAYIRSTSASSVDLSEGEEAIKRKLKWYFMNPYQKFRDKGRKPWKLLLQVVKIILVTIQAIQFAVDHFAVVSYTNDNIDAFRYLFLKNYDGRSQNHDVYTKSDLFGHMFHVWKQYYNVTSSAVGSFTPKLAESSIEPIKVCTKRIQQSYYMNGIDPENEEDFTFNCSYLLTPSANINTAMDFIAKNNLPTEFTWIESVSLHFQLKSINLKELNPEEVADCYTFNVSVYIDNNDQDAVFQLYLECTTKFSHCRHGDVDDDSDDEAFTKASILFLDVVVIVACIVSFGLCTRSLMGHLKLCKETRRFFKDYRHENFEWSDVMNFINFWIVLTLLSDIFTVTGSLIKIVIDQSGMSLYDTCSLFLGVSIVFSWIGVLRYLGYSKNYNVLLVTLKVAFPTVIRFILCAAFIYVGFLFCGWIVFGPYHYKFRNLYITSECLFALINGDDMFATFSAVDTSNMGIFIFSKIYLYTFISLFIFCVNSLFIGIICDTYERIKDYGHPPKTRVELFMEGNEYPFVYTSQPVNTTPIPDGQRSDDIHEGDPILLSPDSRTANEKICYKTF